MHDIFTDFRHSGAFLLLKTSDYLFGNYKVLSFVSSVLLVLLVFFTTKNITKSIPASFVSVLLLVSTFIFRNYDTSVTYPSFWATLFAFSIYLITRGSYTSVIPYYLSIPVKSFTAMFLPAIIMFVHFSSVPNRKRLVLVFISLTVGFVLLLTVLENLQVLEKGLIEITPRSPYYLVEGLGSWANVFRKDLISFVALMVVIPALFLIRKVPFAKSLLFCIFLMILTSPVLRFLTTYDNWDYRFLPLVFLVCVSVGLVLANYTKIKFTKLNKT
jgi:hypothetical protein